MDLGLKLEDYTFTFCFVLLFACVVVLNCVSEKCPDDQIKGYNNKGFQIHKVVSKI